MITPSEQEGAIELQPDLSKKLDGLYEKMKLKNTLTFTCEIKRMLEDHIEVVKDGRKPEIYDGKYSHAWLGIQSSSKTRMQLATQVANRQASGAS